MSDVSQQHLFETIRHAHAIYLDKINPDTHIANGFWSRDQMAVVLARIKTLEAGLAWYTKGENWSGHEERSSPNDNVWCPDGVYDPRDESGYDRARAALAGETCAEGE